MLKSDQPYQHTMRACQRWPRWGRHWSSENDAISRHSRISCGVLAIGNRDIDRSRAVTEW